MLTDSGTLDRIYGLHAPSVFRRARRLLGNDADAYEVVQDVFLSLFEKPEQYEGRSALTTFLYGMTTNACLNRIRNQKNRLRLLRERVQTPEEQGVRELSPEQRSLLHRCLERMPEELAKAAVYYCVDELSHQDIARLLGCSRRHVGDLLKRVGEWGKAQESVPC